MSKDDKKTAMQLIGLALIIVVIEYTATSTVGTFLKIILSIFALKYLKQQDYFAIKTILIILLIPYVWGLYLIVRGILAY